MFSFGWLVDEAEIDERLVGMLEHYRNMQAMSGRPLRVVIAGDFLELVGVSLPPTQVKTLPTREERLHGLGSAADHVVAKVRAIAGRHPRVFRALLELVRAGHELVLVRGNHDIELHWCAAQHAFVEAILAQAGPGPHVSLRKRISIHPWFFLVPAALMRWDPQAGRAAATLDMHARLEARPNGEQALQPLNG